MAQDLFQLLQQRATESRTFADRLRDERAAFQKTASQFAQQTTPQDMYSSNGVPLQPSRVSAGRQALIGAVEQAASPFSPELEMKARGQESDILLQLAALAEKEKGTTPTVSDILKERQTLADAGFDTTAIDAELEKMGLAKKDQTEVETDETLGVKLINDILSRNTAGLTGISRGKLSATGLLSPYETEAAKTSIEQLTGILQLAAAGKLKGSGAISDAERELLRKAASDLGINEKGETKLSDTEFRSRLKQLQIALAKKSGRKDIVDQVMAQTQEKPKSGLLNFLGLVPQNTVVGSTINKLTNQAQTSGGFIIKEVK